MKLLCVWTIEILGAKGCFYPLRSSRDRTVGAESARRSVGVWQRGRIGAPVWLGFVLNQCYGDTQFTYLPIEKYTPVSGQIECIPFFFSSQVYLTDNGGSFGFNLTLNNLNQI